MNAEALLAQYERIAEAPDAIARLRRFVLDLAVRGKLVPQDVGDEPAPALVTRIARGRPPTSLQSLPELPPFEAPPSWCWTTLGSFVLASDAGWSPKTADHPRREGNWGVLKVSAVSWHRFQPHENKEVLPGTEPRLQAQVARGDFLISRANTAELVARAVIVDSNPIQLMMSDKIVRLRLSEHCNHRFVWLVNNYADFARQHYATSASGVSASMKNVSRDVILGLPFPLPPLAEQHRIVAKVDELMALCDRLEAARTAREATRDRLAAASLARLNTPDPETFPTDARFVLDALPALTIRPDQVKQLRQTILNLAVVGRLVPKDPNDEPASELLKRIAKEKAQTGKREKTEVEIDNREELREMPPTWRAVPLIALGSWAIGSGFPKNEQGLGTGPHFFLKVSDMNLPGNEKYVKTSNNLIDDDAARRMRAKIHPRGTIIFPKIGGAIATNKRRILTRGSAIDNNCLGITFASVLNVEWAFLLLTTLDFTRYQAGTAVPALQQGVLERIPVGLPPLAEQHRIVAKVDELMALCDALETSLATTTTTRTRLLEATLHDALDAATAPLREAAA